MGKCWFLLAGFYCTYHLSSFCFLHKNLHTVGLRQKCIHQWRAVSKHSVPLHANFCFLRSSAIGWKSEKLAPHYHDGDDDDDDYYYYYINYLLRLDSVWINMDQQTFCPLMYTPFVLQIWFFGDFVWFHWSYQPNVLQFYRVSQTFEAFAVSFCIKIWIILSCNPCRGLIDLVAEYLNHHASPGEKRSAVNHLYMLWSIFLKKTVIPVKPFGCKR